MTTTDWIIDIALILIVVRQLREERLTLRFVLIPLGIVAYVAHSYLHGLPSGAANLTLVGVAVAIGLTLGVLGGLLTRVRGAEGSAFVKAGPAAAGLWIASMTARLGFIIWITHSSGEHAIARFSAAHGITSTNAWQTALVLLALSEVIARVGIIVIRGYRAAHDSDRTPTAPTQPVNERPVNERPVNDQPVNDQPVNGTQPLRPLDRTTARIVARAARSARRSAVRELISR